MLLLLSNFDGNIINSFITVMWHTLHKRCTLLRFKSSENTRIHIMWRWVPRITGPPVAGENVVTWLPCFDLSSPPFISGGSWLLEVEEFNNGRGRVARRRALSENEESALRCWWPAEVALIHRNFTGCQAGLTGLCHGSNAEESHPAKISVSAPNLQRITNEFRSLAYLSVFAYLRTNRFC